MTTLLKFFERLLLSFVVIAFLGVTFSCSDDDDDKSSYEEPDVPDVPENQEEDESLDPVEVTYPIDDGILKILAIGNSFSVDAVEYNLFDLCKAAGVSVLIGNMYIGGCSLETHYNNAMNDAPNYEYRKIVGGNKTNTTGVTLKEAIEDENWDYISLQQVSGLSGLYDTYTPYLPGLIEYVRENVVDENTQIILHQTWAYATTSTHNDFPRYGSDQMTMYNAIVSTVNQAAEDNGIEIIIPCGTAVQNGRASSLGDTFNRDGYHLNYDYGRYTAACTWFEKLTGINARTTTYSSTLDDDTKAIVTHAAHYAVMNPNEVNPMTNYQ